MGGSLRDEQIVETNNQHLATVDDSNRTPLRNLGLSHHDYYMFYRDFCKLLFAIICHYWWEGTPQLISWFLHPFGLNGCLFSCQVHDVQPPTVGCLAFEATNFVA